MKRETVLVTGVTGVVGSTVVNALFNKPVNIVVGARDLSKLSSEDWGDRVEKVTLDYENDASIKQSLSGVDRIFLVTPPWYFHEDGLAKKIIEFGREQGLAQIIRLSAICADEIAEFGHHQEADELLLNADIPSISVRPNTFMQNFLNFGLISRESDYTLKLNAGSGRTSFIDVRDIATVVASMLMTHDYDNASYILTGHESLSFFDVAEKFSTALGQKVSYQPMSDDAWFDMALASGTPKVVAESFLAFNRGVSQGDYANISPTVEEILGRAPLSLDQYIKDYIDQFKS